MTVTAVTVELREDVAVARLHGDIDPTNTATVTADVLEGCPPGTLGVVIDLGTVRYLDSAGIQMLLDLVRMQAERRQGIAFALPEGSPVATLITITNLDEVAPISASVDAAVIALRASDPEMF